MWDFSACLFIASHKVDATNAKQVWQKDQDLLLRTSVSKVQKMSFRLLLYLLFSLLTLPPYLHGFQIISSSFGFLMNLYNRSFTEPPTTIIDHRSASLATTPIHYFCSFVGANFANISNNICNVWSHLSAKYSCMDILSVCRYLVMLRKNGFVMVRNENWILRIPILFSY